MEELLMSELIGSTAFHPITVPTGAATINKIERSVLTHELTDDTRETVQTLFRQLTHALTVLSSAAELTKEQTTSIPTQHIRIWLQPSARRAEDVLRRLRNLNLPASLLVTDLTQSLTVLVLAADMITQGHLSGTVMPELYSLMRRNAERAMSCMVELRSAIGE
jgi:hypothetical protein